MKIIFKQPIWMLVAKITGLISFSILLLTSSANAANISGGSLILNIDRDALIAGVNLDNYPDTPTSSFTICCRPSIYVEEFYDASASSKTFLQLRDANTPDLFDSISDEISAIGLEFQVNGPTISPNPAGRQNRSTTLEFNPSNFEDSITGRIGLGGAMRFRVDVAPPTNRVLMGDMALIYDVDNENLAPGQSRWTLMNYIGFPAVAFDLFDVTTQLTGNSLTLSGELGLGEGFDHLGGIRDTRVGTFSFQTSIVPVPVPAAAWLFLSGLIGLGVTASKRSA